MRERARKRHGLEEKASQPKETAKIKARRTKLGGKRWKEMQRQRQYVRKEELQ